MNKRNPLANVPVTIQQFVTQAPAYPWTGPGLIRRLKEAVDMAECGPGLKLPQRAFGQLIGAATTTLHDWTEGDFSPIRCRPCCAVWNDSLKTNGSGFYVDSFGSAPDWTT